AERGFSNTPLRQDQQSLHQEPNTARAKQGTLRQPALSGIRAPKVVHRSRRAWNTFIVLAADRGSREADYAEISDECTCCSNVGWFRLPAQAQTAVSTVAGTVTNTTLY